LDTRNVTRRYRQSSHLSSVIFFIIRIHLSTRLAVYLHKEEFTELSSERTSHGITTKADALDGADLRASPNLEVDHEKWKKNCRVVWPLLMSRAGLSPGPKDQGPGAAEGLAMWVIARRSRQD